MKELHDIIRAFEEAQKHGKQAALATVVQVEGSSYRRPGARMLVTDDGKLTGAISGGCLEGDALRKALSVIAQQKSRLVTYDTSDEDDAKLGVGLGCNGIIHILFEPLDPAKPDNPIEIFKKIFSHRQNASLITLFSMDSSAIQVGTCLLRLEDGTIISGIADHKILNVLLPDAQSVLQNMQSITRNYDFGENNFRGFVELIRPLVSLVIVGAGNDVMPLAKMAGILGWRITVVDGRRDYATAARFPGVQKLITSKPENVLSQLSIDAQTVFVLMTHNYNYDLAMLRELIIQPVRYTGVLGPKKKLERLMNELKDEGIPETGERSNIYGPVGLDIGAETAEEIALSIIAEIKAVMAGRSGGFLKGIHGTIHSRDMEGEAGLKMKN
ncbi:MAG TPA: XdhC/CoxI family protein [Puia sp.]|nr:XdhC/CoxI family protein [Puia sp.]